MNAVLAVLSCSKAMAMPLKNNAPNVSSADVMYSKSIHIKNLEESGTFLYLMQYFYEHVHVSSKLN